MNTILIPKPIRLSLFVFLFFIVSCKDKYEKDLKAASEIFLDRQSEKIKNLNLNDSNFIKFWNANMLDKMDFTPRMTDSMKNETLARAYIEYFKNSRPSMTRSTPTGSISIDPTQSVWIDKNVIKSFAKEMIDNPDIDGIRVYYARYLDFATTLDSQLDKRFDGRETMIFVATTKVKGDKFSYHKDYYHMPGNGNKSALYIYDYNSLCPPLDTCTGATLGGY